MSPTVSKGRRNYYHEKVIVRETMLFRLRIYYLICLSFDRPSVTTAYGQVFFITQLSLLQLVLIIHRVYGSDRPV